MDAVVIGQKDAHQGFAMRIVRRWDNHLRFPCNNPQLNGEEIGQSLLMGMALTMSALGMPACPI